MNAILFDIGRTKTRVAFSDNPEQFEDPIIFETDEKYETGLQKLIRNIKECGKDKEIKNIVGGKTRALIEWSDEKLIQDLKNEFGENINIKIENDSALVGLGEAVYGVGKDFEIVAYITVSTGVGGARIVNKKIDERAVGFEPGKQIIDIDSESTKTLEDLISGSALKERTGMNPKEITDPKVWDQHAKVLAIGLNNVVVNWSPNCIVLGGSMITGDPAIPIDKTENYLKEILKVYSEIPVIKKAELGDFGGLWGALALIKNNV